MSLQANDASVHQAEVISNALHTTAGMCTVLHATAGQSSCAEELQQFLKVELVGVVAANQMHDRAHSAWALYSQT